MAPVEENLEANMDQQSHLKVWMFVAIPIVGVMLAVAGHLFIR